MAFDVKELMVDITNASAVQQFCHPSVNPPCWYSGYPTMLCHPSKLPCKFGTYTCFAGSIVTCGGTIYCAGTEDPTLLFKDIDREILTEIKAQLHSALKEVEQREKQFSETPSKLGKEKRK